MADILGKDLDNYDESLAARQPFSLSESDTAGPKFMTGADLVRSAKISADWKDPIAIRTQAYTPVAKLSQPVLSAGRSMVDSLVNLPSNVANLVAQGVLESTGRYEPAVNVVSILADKNKREQLRKAFEEDQESVDETIKLLSGRDYSVDKWARRVIANSTANVENRKVVRELYNQAQGIDSSKWYNEAGAIIGAMVPTMAVGNTAFATSRAFGAGRVAAAKTASNVAKGYIGAEMAGQYAEETAAQYLQRTGDKNFENFTAKDASGLSAAAYGAIGAQIEFMGGVEPIMAGALTKVGLRSGGLKAAAKIGVGEATEELLQGLTETLFRKIEGTTDKTWKEGFEDSLKGAAWGLFIGGTMGTTAFYVNRRNLVKGIKTALPNISDTEAQLVADAMIDNTAEMSSQDPTLRQNLRNKVALMYRDVDVDNKDTVIDATTDLEYSLIAMDAIDRGIEITDHEIFQGEVNELGWFREGIPEAQRPEIKAINDNILELKKQLEELNKAEKKDWAKIEETENKLAQASQYVLERVSDLATEFKKLEDRYVEKEKQKALDAFEATQEQKELANSSASQVFNTLSNEGINVQQINNGKPTKHGAVYLQINRKGAKSFKIRLGVTPIGALHKSVVANFNVVTMTPEQILARVRNLIENKYQQMNKKAKGGVNIGFGEEPMFQPEQFDLADENARLDDIYPEYKGKTIIVDGVERTVYNSNGDRIAKSAEALTNFWRWFGDSKVVDEQDRPLVVYHGTSEKFDTFMRGKDKAGKFDYETPSGFFFKSSDKNIGIAGNIQMPVYLKAEKSITFDNREQLQQYWVKNIDGYAELLDKYKNVDKEYNAKTDKIDEQLDKAIDDLEKSEAYKNATDAQQYQMRSDLVDNFDTTEFFAEWRNATDKIAEQMKQLVNDYVSANNIEMVKLENDSGAIGKKTTDSFIVFKPNQIKSVNNRGTYSADTGNIYYQNEESERNLVVTHGITPDKLEKVLKLGGFPVPSIAISKITEPLTNFGTIKLVGTKNIINPELRSSNLVYDRDIWSKRFPRPEYKNAKMADVRKFRDKFEKYFVRADNSSVLYGSITDPLVNSRYPAQAIEAFQNSDGAKLYYIENFLGDKIDVPKYDRAKRILDNLTLFVKADEQFIKEIAEIDVNIGNIDKLRKEVEKPIRDLINRYDFEKEYGKYADKIKQEAENHYFSEKFKGSDITYMIRSAKEYLRMLKDDNIRYGVDQMGLDAVINKYNLYDNKEYMDWSEKQITDLLGEPRVRVGNKLMPWTVENIAASMIKGKTIGTESDSISVGKIIASGAERFTNLESIREAGKRLQPQKQSEEQTDQLGHDMYMFAEDIIAAAELSDNYSNVDMVLLSLQEGVSKNSITEDSLEKLLNKNLDILAKYPRNMLKRGVELIKQTKEIVRFYFEAKPQRVVSLNEFAGAVVPTDARYNDISAKLRERGLYVARTNNLEEGIRYIESQTPVLFQNRKSGAAPSTYRGAYIPEYRFILRANKMDASTLSHELAHDWMEANFDRYRSGKQSKDFMKAWGALEKALGIPENATSVPRKASEAFARAYEAWIVQNEDWTKFISVDDKDRDAVEKLMKDYQGELRDIYNDISNPYFKQTWGKLGELKPELKAWFDRVVNITDLDVMVERGEMTESQASAEKLNRAIDTVIENTVDEETKLALEEAKTLNDTARYEVEGGNQNSIQRRLSALAKEIDENGITLKGDKYDTRRDMMQVAEAADNFVKTRLDDALAIINGQMAEVEGLYKEDLYTALERLAVENGDLGLIDELKNSEVANKLAKELGQRVAGFRNFKQSTDIDVVSALKSLDMKFNKALDNKKAKQEYDSALKLLDESLKQQDKIADKELDSFLEDLKCK